MRNVIFCVELVAGRAEFLLLPLTQIFVLLVISQKCPVCFYFHLEILCLWCVGVERFLRAERKWGNNISLGRWHKIFLFFLEGNDIWVFLTKKKK